ncbi:Solute carrier family 46 member 3 [Halotydeus destructor]|nr:Solute carrier family 46 member 3 [Halotydeus destructor]
MAVYLLNTVVGLLALIYVAISINEKPSDPATESIVNEDTTEQELLHQDNEASSWYSPLKSLFDLTNVRTMIQVLTKHRQGKDRTVLWVMVLGHSLIFLGYMGGSAVCYQFTQKAFSWSFEKYNNVNATTSSLGILSTMAAIPLFIKYFKFRDLTMVITGTLSVFLTMTLRGTLLTEMGFYVAYFIGTLTPVAMIASRSFLSKLVTQDEGGTVFAILSCLEAVVPLIATSLFTGIFNDTIDTMPGLVYQCAGALLVIPLIGYLWVDHHYRVDDYSRAAT